MVTCWFRFVHCKFLYIFLTKPLAWPWRYYKIAVMLRFVCPRKVIVEKKRKMLIIEEMKAGDVPEILVGIRAEVHYEIVFKHITVHNE